MNIYRKFTSSVVMISLVGTAAIPAMAATGFSPEAAKADSAGPDYEQATEYYRRYRHRRNRIDAGDIIAGIGIIAGIAIIADAASKSSRRNTQDRYPDRRVNSNRSQSYPASDMGSAVTSCSNAAEQSAGNGVRVDEIRSATRDGDGWRVSGYLNDTRSFDCGVGNRGVDFIQLGDQRDAI